MVTKVPQGFCFGFPTACSLSKPDPVKRQISHLFTSVSKLGEWRAKFTSQYLRKSFTLLWHVSPLRYCFVLKPERIKGD